jgi:hypothetical protein
MAASDDAGGPSRPPVEPLALSELFRKRLGRPGRRDDSARSRLVGEVTAYEATVESLLARVEALNGDTTWATECQQLVDETWAALDTNAIEPAWQTFHAAQRSFVNGLAELDDGGEALQSHAEVVLGEAVSNLGSWRLATVTRLLTDGSGNVRDDLSPQVVIDASKLLDEQYENVHRKRRHLEYEFNQLFWLSLVSIGLFLGLAALAEIPTGIPYTEVLQRPFGGEAAGIETDIRSVGFAVFVVLSGILGASMFGMRSLVNRSLSTKVPQRITTLTATVARGVIGGASSLFLYLFIVSDFVAIVFTPQLLLAIGFVAGYSERLVPRAMEEVAAVIGLVEEREPADPTAVAAALGAPVETSSDDAGAKSGAGSGGSDSSK